MKVEHNGTLTWNWLRVNVPQIAAVFGAVLFINSWMNDVDASLVEMEKYRVSRSTETDKNFANVNAKLDALSDIPLRTTQNEEAIKNANVRIDRLAESIVNSMDMLRKEVYTMSTKVEVLSQKIDSITPQRSNRAQVPKPPALLAE